MYNQFYSENLKGIFHLGDVDSGRRIILKWVLMYKSECVWSYVEQGSVQWRILLYMVMKGRVPVKGWNLLTI
jgi:hypothetical protein